MRNVSIAILVTLGLLLLIAPGCTRRADPPESSDPPLATVRARAVEEHSFEDAVIAQGQWRSSGEIVVGSPAAGTIDSLAVQLGERVTAGRVLCLLTTRESQATLRGATFLAQRAHDEKGSAEAERALDLARREMIRVPVTAPRAGIISRMAVHAGGEIAESGEILAILPPDAIVFEAHVGAADARRIRSGQHASIDGEGGPARSAIVRRILPTAGAIDQATLVWLNPESMDVLPEIDRFGTATIFVGTSLRALAVPDSSIVQDDLTGRTKVAAISALNLAIWTDVSLGLGSRGWHELKSPALAPGTLVIVDGHRGLPDSTRVKLAP
jgi:biotin carboxyl carrier protein